MALHCFLVNFPMYSGLLPTLISFFLSFQCLTFVIVSVSFWIPSMTLVFISSWRCFFGHSFDIMAIWSLTLSSPAILFTSFPHSLCFDKVTSLMRVSFCMLSIRLPCRTCFFFIMYSTVSFPISFNRIVVGVPFGKYRIVLGLHWRWTVVSSVLLCSGSSPRRRTSLLVLLWRLPFAIQLSSLCSWILGFPFQRGVVPQTLLSISLMWSDRLPLLLMVSPRYL